MMWMYLHHQCVNIVKLDIELTLHLSDQYFDEGQDLKRPTQCRAW